MPTQEEIEIYREHPKPADGEDELCGNCGTPRSVDTKGYVERCPNCGDDEYNVYESMDVP